MTDHNLAGYLAPRLIAKQVIELRQAKRHAEAQELLDRAPPGHRALAEAHLENAREWWLFRKRRLLAGMDDSAP